MNILCFVGNNNPSVWQKRRQVFHIGLPTGQTTAAVARVLAQDATRQHFLLLHDENEFQRRAAAGMESALRSLGRDVRSQLQAPGDITETVGWKPDAIQLIFSSERKALPIVRAIRAGGCTAPLILGRSLLRLSFLRALGESAGEIWFVDTAFRRSGHRSDQQKQFLRVMADNDVEVPTTNHAFGWDMMSFCARALEAAQGNPAQAIDYLESGVAMEGATGACRFSPDNHNGRLGPGPTLLTRWAGGRLEGMQTDTSHIEVTH